MEKLMNLKRAFLILIAAMFLPGLAFAQVTARFETTLVFTDVNPVATTVVHRDCNTGLPLNQFFEMGHQDIVDFTSTLLPVDEPLVQCTITAADVPNYTTWYSEFGGPSAVFEPEPCDWTGVELDILDWTAECHIRMVPVPASVTVSKDWDFTGVGGDIAGVNTTVEFIAWSYDDVLVGGRDCLLGEPGGVGSFCLEHIFIGATPSNWTFGVLAGYSGETVYVVEDDHLDSSVEPNNTCGVGRLGSVSVFPGDSPSCTFTNTVFYEGIPTLSQYGLAIMALLMLGVGFVGFRRFV
jgi:hypothetical protein